MAITATAALWFFIAVLPICIYVAWSDLSSMRIPNRANYLLFALYFVLAPFLVGWSEILWSLAFFAIVLIVGFFANAFAGVGAGDSKFAAAAAPYISSGTIWSDSGDLRLLLMIFTAALLGAFIAHRIARHTAIRTATPHWSSWTHSKFPVGLVLTGTLLIYLGMGVVLGR